jgi:hypothetical protein
MSTITIHVQLPNAGNDDIITITIQLRLPLPVIDDNCIRHQISSSWMENTLLFWFSRTARFCSVDWFSVRYMVYGFGFGGHSMDYLAWDGVFGFWSLLRLWFDRIRYPAIAQVLVVEALFTDFSLKRVSNHQTLFPYAFATIVLQKLTLCWRTTWLTL